MKKTVIAILYILLIVFLACCQDDENKDSKDSSHVTPYQTDLSNGSLIIIAHDVRGETNQPSNDTVDEQENSVNKQGNPVDEADQKSIETENTDN